MSTVQETSPHESTTEPEILKRERSLLRELLGLVSERADVEAMIEKARTAGDAASEAEYQRASTVLREKVANHESTSRTNDEERRRAIIDSTIAGEAEAKSAFAKASRRIATEFDSLRQRAGADHQNDKAEAATVLNAGEREAALNHAKAKRPLDDATKIINSYRHRLTSLFDAYQKFGLAELTSTPTRETYKFDNPTDVLFDRLSKVEKPLKFLEGLIIPKAMKGSRPIWLFVVAFLVILGPLIYFEGEIVVSIVLVVVAIALGFLMRAGLYALSKKQINLYFYPVHQTVLDAESLAFFCSAKAKEQLDAERTRLVGIRDNSLLQAKAKQTKTVSTGEHVRDERLREINEIYARRMVEIQTQQQVDLSDAIEAYKNRKEELSSKSAASARKLEDKLQDHKQSVMTRYQNAWEEMSTRWYEGLGRIKSELAVLTHEVDLFGPPWSDSAWNDRSPSSIVPAVVRFGQITIDLKDLPGGISADSRLMEGQPTQFSFPAIRSFADRPNLLIQTATAGRPTALGVLQAAVLRLFTSLPPGAVRFTIIDPIGIGRNFGAFMHMADYDEALVNGQVWSEPRQIEERLTELAMHMERVTQKYLRNDYATIEEYNAAAGEVAEPYRVLVIADYPAGFDEKSLARLSAIAARGVPCGVLTLLLVDLDRAPGTDLDPVDLGTNAEHLTWVGDRLIWDDPDFGRFPLTLDLMPPAEFSTRLIQRSAKEARDARRVEVPFEFIAPPQDQFWESDSRAGIDVPLGKSGANKRHHLALGKGTAQHVLVAGRTGSGKSTLLHALITNVALNYSPDEVELYLIDFKKGVEFKVYVTHELPHAKVVAIESEREFGISVLQRLDGELKARADRFREAGVQDVNGYRNAGNLTALPRILLIVDEFQEFFVEEDKLAQEAALLLDRLVRQGRAFGIHVILGSQTLGGAFTLARTTIGQMAVRIALQCSDADSHLILSEENTAARMLSRPGEAVYNDANGMTEGNHFFQVVWLSDDRRESYLQRLQSLARERPPKLTSSAIVFEGDAPAELSRNMRLKPLIQAAAWPTTPRSAQAWVGEPVAIKDPTAVLFRRQGGSHLLIVGQNEDAARGIMASSMISLAAQYAPAGSDKVRAGAKFILLDGTPEDHPQSALLASLAGILPHPIELGSWRELPRLIATLVAEVERRGQPEAHDGPEIFLFIQDLPRFRDLRKGEDEFSFSRKEEAATPADSLKTILREGPGLGVHVLIWSDSLNNLNRSFDNQSLREFDMRILFQMSQNDSGHLLDSPAAGKLGPHRALFASEEQNRLEKFRPYQFPPAEWLGWLKAEFHKRTETGG